MLRYMEDIDLQENEIVREHIMTKDECLQFLKERVPFSIYEHPAVYNMEETHAIHLPHEEWIAKNLFLRDDKKQNYYLIAVHGSRKINLKALQKEIGSRRLTFASEADLERYLGVKQGAVTPLGLLNDVEHKVKFYLDTEFRKRQIGMHPMENTATVFLDAEALMNLLHAMGCEGNWLSLQSAL
jgi:Ala-tRNA(Pro) deacylase